MGQDREILLKHADVALYQAKDRGRNTYAFFNRDINRQPERLILENGLRCALKQQDLTVAIRQSSRKRSWILSLWSLRSPTRVSWHNQRLTHNQDISG